jgi:hypothetical protein
LECEDAATKENKLPPLVSQAEMQLMVSIQILALVMCGVNPTVIKVAGDKVGAALGLVELQTKEVMPSLWKVKAEIGSFLPIVCKIFHIKHTAFYFHQHPKLNSVVFAPLDHDKHSSVLRMAKKEIQYHPDHRFMFDMSKVVFEELYILASYYVGLNFELSMEHLRIIYNNIKDSSRLGFLLAGDDDFDSFWGNELAKYGSFDNQRQIPKWDVFKGLNPMMNRSVVQDTKLKMGSDRAAAINRLMPEPRVLDNKNQRSKNQWLKIECKDYEWFDSGLKRQSVISWDASIFFKLWDRCHRNSRTIYSGQSGNWINQLFDCKGKSQNDKCLLMFLKPGLDNKLRKRGDSKSLMNLHVVAASLDVKEPKKATLISTLVGPGKTTSLNPANASFAQSFLEVLEKNTCIVFNQVSQTLGLISFSNETLAALSTACDSVPSCFTMDKWLPFDIASKLMYFSNGDVTVNCFEDGAVVTPVKMNDGRSNHSDLAVKFNGNSLPSVDDAATFHVIKRQKKTYSKESEQSNELSLCGELFLDLDGSSVYLKIVLEENKEVNLKIEW